MKSVLFVTTALFLFAAPVWAEELNETSTLVDEKAPNDLSTPSIAPQFDSVIEDLPLMPGLSVVPNNDVVFVTPRSGRIVDTSAEGVVEVDDVYQFYKTSLPPLGWKSVDARTYRRNDEILHIKAHGDGKVTTVEFSVKPNS
jgi:hypothetical protein